MSKRFLIPFVALIALISQPAWALSQRTIRPAGLPTFTVQVIGPTSTLPVFMPYGVNDSGTIAGTQTSPFIAGYFFSKGKIHHVAPPKGRAASEITGINDSGRVSGEACLSPSCNSPGPIGADREGQGNVENVTGPSGSSLCTFSSCISVANAVGPTGDLTGRFGSQAVLWAPATHGSYSIRQLPYTDSSRFTSLTGLAVDGFGDVAGTESEGSITVGVLWPHNGTPVLLPGCGEFSDSRRRYL